VTVRVSVDDEGVVVDFVAVRAVFWTGEQVRKGVVNVQTTVLTGVEGVRVGIDRAEYSEDGYEHRCRGFEGVFVRCEGCGRAEDVVDGYVADGEERGGGGLGL